MSELYTPADYVRREGYYTAKDRFNAMENPDVFNKEYQAVCMASQHDLSKAEAREMVKTCPETAIANACDWFALSEVANTGISAQTKSKLYDVLTEARKEIAEANNCSELEAICIREEAMGHMPEGMDFTESVESISETGNEMEQ